MRQGDSAQCGSEQQGQQGGQRDNRHHPPEPTDAARTSSFGFAEFLVYKFLVVKGSRGYAEPVRSRPLGPAGLLIGPAFRAGFGPGWYFCPALGTDLRRRVQLEEWRISLRPIARTRKGDAPFGTGSPHS